MKHSKLALTLALVMGVSGIASAQSVDQGALTETQVRTHLGDQGYSKIHDVAFKHGMWHAEALSGDGAHVDLRIDPRTGQAYPDAKGVSRLSKNDVRASLATAGYTDVHDVDFDDGLWTAKAKNPAGHHVKLQIDPNSGKVVGSED
jgi:hypothetical protein